MAFVRSRRDIVPETAGHRCSTPVLISARLARGSAPGFLECFLCLAPRFAMLLPEFEPDVVLEDVGYVGHWLGTDFL